MSDTNYKYFIHALLPSDLYNGILQYVMYEDYQQFRGVCKYWRDYFNNKSLGIISRFYSIIN